jgi:carboxymethylenebutenolidase
MPVNDVERLKTLKPDVLGIFASREKYISQEVVSKLENNMKAGEEPYCKILRRGT